MHQRIENLSNLPEVKKDQFRRGQFVEKTLSWDRELNERSREGDLLVFTMLGSMALEMSSASNSHFKPAEVLVENGEARLIRRRDVFEDLLKNQAL